MCKFVEDLIKYFFSRVEEEEEAQPLLWMEVAEVMTEDTVEEGKMKVITEDMEEEGKMQVMTEDTVAEGKTQIMTEDTEEEGDRQVM